jgi:hypothetical protein
LAVDGVINDLAHFFKPDAGTTRFSRATDGAALLWSSQLQFKLVRKRLHTVIPLEYRGNSAVFQIAGE